MFPLNNKKSKDSDYHIIEMIFYSRNEERWYSVADWDSMGHQSGQAFQTLGRAFGFFFNLQKFGRVFESLAKCLKVIPASRTLGLWKAAYMYWNLRIVLKS